MKILLVSDAWSPQTNGVVRTLQTVVLELERAGHEVRVVHPGLFRTFPCPTYPEIRLALFPGRTIRRIAREFEPQAVHIATEGPLGVAARRVCRKQRWPFTTAYHTRFPEYVNARFPIPTRLGYRVMRWFHGPATRVMVATETLENELRGRGFDNTARWNRGVDTELFHPRPKDALPYERPIHVYVGRVAVEKGIETFLGLDLPGTKLVVGDGPQRAGLQKRYPDVVFAGAKHGEELATHYAASDVFVFPSRTDTFGLVLLEALASGVPVAALPVAGPIDVITDPRVGVLDPDLASAAKRALELDPDDCRAFALEFSWARCAERFFELLAPFGSGVAATP